MNWKILTSEEQIEDLKKISSEKPQLVFKHSTRCSISVMIKTRLEKEIFPESIDFFYLDLLKYRNLSNKLAEDFNVHHESPQVLLIKNGDCIYEESHNGIRMEEILNASL
jgi:hypothetical protein